MKNLKKKIYNSFLTIGMSSVLAVATVVSLQNLNSSSTNHADKVSSSLNADTTTSNDASTYLLPWNLATQSTNDLSSPVQHIAFDSSGTTFTLLTSSSSTYSTSSTLPTTSSTTSNTYDYLTNYSMSTGASVWSTGATSLTFDSSYQGETFVAVSYITPYGTRNGYFAAVVETNNTSTPYYFALLSASDGSLVSSSAISGITSTSDNDQFYIQDNSFTSLDINVYGFDITSTDSSKVVVDNFTSDSNDSTTLTSTNNAVTIDSSLVTNYFAVSGSTVTSKLTKTYDDKSYLYFVFQDSSITYNSASKNYVTILRVTKTATNPTINATSIYSLSLTSDQVNQLTTSSSANNLSVAIASDESSSTVILSSSNTNNYLVTSVTSTMFYSASESTTFQTLTYAADNAFIVSVSSLYSSTSSSDSSSIQGYVALLSNNTAVEISADFSSITLLYDFSNLSTADNGSKLIFNIFTVSGDANWYAQMTDGSIIQFSGSNLVGQLGSDSVNNRTEFLASVSMLTQSEIPSSVLFQKVTDGSSSTATSTFQSYISTNASQFFSVSSYDSVFGEPLFSAKVTSVSEISGTSNYSVAITFYQSLRKISNGSIDSSNPTNVVIGSGVYTFTNTDSTITVADKSSVPASITSLLPSEVTTAQVEQILDIENAGNYTISLEPDDTEGTLTVKVKSDAVWIDGQLMTDYTQTVTIGSADSPYFTIDVFNGLDSSVSLVTDSYLDESDNATLKTTLTNKYSGTLPSEVTAQDIIDDFLVFGSAFSNTQLLASGIVEKPTVDDVELYPVDALGYVYVTVTIPKIGSQTNVVYSFKTASVFQEDFTSNQDVYLSFKNNQSVLNSSYSSGTGEAATTSVLGNLSPSNVVNLINNDKSVLFYFMDMSYYVYNLLAGLDSNNANVATLSLTPNDALGTLTIDITFNQTISGLDSSYSCVFSGFNTSGSSTGQPSSLPTFSWGEIDANALSGMKPADVTASYLETNYPGLFVYGNSASQLSHTVTVTPMNASGAVLVTITFTDWWEEQTSNGTTTTVKIPEKTFTTVLKNGLSVVEDSVDSVVWDSFSELTSSDATITASTASNAVTLINSLGSDLEKLEKVANISDSLLTKLNTAIADNPDALSLSMTADDSTGTLSFYATMIIDGVTYNFSNTLSGFDLVNTDYSVSLATDTSTAAAALKSTIPSDLTYEQIASLVTVTLGNGLEKEITTSYDDIQGTLTVNVNLYKDNSVVASTSRTYTGFATSNISYHGTNVLIVVLSAVIPIILLLSPILYIVLFKSRRDAKKLAKVLDKRLTEESKKKKYVEVNTIADLLKLDSDRN